MHREIQKSETTLKISVEITRKFEDSESRSKCQFLFLKAKSRIDLRFLRGQCNHLKQVKSDHTIRRSIPQAYFPER